MELPERVLIRPSLYTWGEPGIEIPSHAPRSCGYLIWYDDDLRYATENQGAPLVISTRETKQEYKLSQLQIRRKWANKQ